MEIGCSANNPAHDPLITHTQKHNHYMIGMANEMIDS